METPGPIIAIKRALTLWQPWAYAIVRGPKRIENRDWMPPTWLVGQYIAIHAAAKKVKPIECALIEESTGFHIEPADLTFSAVVGVARVSGVITESKDRWFMGKYGWILDDVRPIEPVPCKGGMKLWNLTRTIGAIVEEGANSPEARCCAARDIVYSSA